MNRKNNNKEKQLKDNLPQAKVQDKGVEKRIRRRNKRNIKDNNKMKDMDNKNIKGGIHHNKMTDKVNKEEEKNIRYKNKEKNRKRIKRRKKIKRKINTIQIRIDILIVSFNCRIYKIEQDLDEIFKSKVSFWKLVFILEVSLFLDQILKY